jgi:hypothetical protein
MYRTATAICLVLAAVAPARADLTVDQAWGVWRAQFRALGLVADATETRDGDALQIGDVRLTALLPYGIGKGYVAFSGPRFEPVGDGTVRFGFEPQMQLIVGGNIAGQGSFEAELTGRAASYSGTMSGTPEHAVSDWSAGDIEYRLTRLAVDGAALPDIAVNGILRLGPSSGRNTTTMDGAHLTFAQTAEIASYGATYDVDMGADLGRMNGEEAVAALRNTVNMVLPIAGIAPLDLHNQLRDGLSLAVRGTNGPQVSRQRVESGGEVLSRQQLTIDSGTTSMTLDRAGLGAGVDFGALDMDLLTPEIPLPIKLAAKGGAFRFLMPLLADTAPQDGAYVMSLRDFTLDEGLWALFDPTRQLPRDPATVTVDLSGKMTLKRDLVDFEGLAELETGEVPVEINAATLNGLVLRAAGAEMTGTGAFTFDNGDLESFDGMPRPEGAVDMHLTGSATLIDRLIAMGLLGEDDAMGARLAIGLVAKPAGAPGEDVLRSQVTITDQGHIIANGQRLK